MIFSISQIFGQRQPEEISSLFDQFIHHRFQVGELLFDGQADDNHPLILILQHGTVAISSHKPADSRLLGPGAIICYLPSIRFTSLVDEGVRISGATPGEALLLSAADFHALKEQGLWQTPLK